MYEAFYHLNTNPFRIAPDPRFCFHHASYKSAREYLDYALRLGDGFIMVTGPPGTGKTTLVETFLKDLDLARLSAKRIAASGLGADDMLRAVAYAYGIDGKGLDKATLRRRIQQYFGQQEQSGRRALLIIDEAQGLPYPALEELRLLADLQARSQPLLQLFLVGQEGLRGLMRKPEMEQFQQRIIATCHLKPLGLWETRAYIKHRLCQAGWAGDPELRGAALLAIHQWSRGVPRHINKICNRLLVLGYGKAIHTLDKEDVHAVSVELGEEQLSPLGNAHEAPADISPAQSMAEHGNGAFSLAELTLRRDSEEDENTRKTVDPIPVSRPAMFVATRQVRQPAPARTEARRSRETQPKKSPAPQRSSASRPAKVCRRYGRGVIRRPASPNRLRIEMTLGIAALAIATLVAVGTVRFSGISRTDRATLPGERRALIEPSRPAHDHGKNTETASLQAGKPERETQARDSIARPMPQELLGDTDRRRANRNAAVVEGAKHQRTPDSVSTVTPRGVTLAPAESVTPSGQDSDPSHDGSGISGPTAAQSDVAMVAPNAAGPEFESMDAPAAGDRADKTVPADKHSVQLPVSREAKIAALLAQGKQSLQEFRLLTPAGDNAHHYFQEVLALDPGNTDARDGLEQIVKRYATLVRRANERQNTRLARVYLSRGLRVQPGNRELLALQESMQEPPVTPEETVAKHSPRVEPEPQPTSFFSRLKSFFTKGQGEPAEVVERSGTTVDP
jgi:type II secretory pathway predicted ATPase ExeA